MKNRVVLIVKCWPSPSNKQKVVCPFLNFAESME